MLFQYRKYSEVRNDPFALVTCDLSNHNGATQLCINSGQEAQQNHQLIATEESRLLL